MDIPEVVVLEVLSRLPLKSIARFRSVKKEWKSLIDSDYLRDYFISLNSSSSVSWSIIPIQPHKVTLEIVGHHGCKVLGLAQSPGTLMRFLLETTRIREVSVLACTDGLVLIFAEASDGTPMYYIGNPLFQEWFRVPLPTITNGSLSDIGLVTKVERGVVVSYKIAAWLSFNGKYKFMVYSSDTGMWEALNVTFRLHSELWYRQEKSIALNGILHWLSSRTCCIVAYNFYGGYNDGDDDDDKCRFIHFPGSTETCFKITFTTSEGFIVYFNEFQDHGSCILRAWKLVKYTDVVAEAWQLFWEVNLVSLVGLGIDYFPVVMHPLKSEIIYLWSMNKKSLILYNLKTHVFSLHNETEVDNMCMNGCVLSFNDCSEYMNKIDEINRWNSSGSCLLLVSQYVLPRWLHRLPRPRPRPQP